MALLLVALRTTLLSFLLATSAILGTLLIAPSGAVADSGPGGHNHGSISCGSDWRVTVSGAYAQRNGSPGPGGSSRVYYRAVIYQWNGDSWVTSAASPWQLMTPLGYGVANFKATAFTINTAGYFAVQTEFYWFDYRNMVFYGASAGWASNGGYCTYR